MSVLVVGSLALDTVETPFGSREEVLGGSATYFSMAASYFSPIQLVGVVGADFPERHVQLLKNRRVDLAGLTKADGRTFRWRGRYCDQMNEAQTLDTELNVFEQFNPVLPSAFRDAPFVFLGNIDPDLQSRVLDQIDHRKLVAADTMNFWINRKGEALRKTLERVDLLFVNDTEARALSGESSTVRAARQILRMGPRVVVIKRGEYGVMLLDKHGFFSIPAYPTAEVRDPTGAGDSFAGGFMGFLARVGEVTPATLRQATAIGTVLASFTVEGFSLERLIDVTASQVAERFERLRRMTDLQPFAKDMALFQEESFRLLEG
ncbi:MAG: PfkB family carbohydrate kinase [Myxococcales bacterium]|jgi:sugar/nucleoside kinase (ribokinase family)|nr:PfkB family carbohydrate kinase [Myxococcales bacterium]